MGWRRRNLSHKKWWRSWMTQLIIFSESEKSMQRRRWRPSIKNKKLTLTSIILLILWFEDCANSISLLNIASMESSCKIMAVASTPAVLFKSFRFGLQRPKQRRSRNLTEIGGRKHRSADYLRHANLMWFCLDWYQ